MGWVVVVELMCIQAEGGAVGDGFWLSFLGNDPHHQRRGSYKTYNNKLQLHSSINHDSLPIARATSSFFQAEDGIRDVERSRGLGDVYKRQAINRFKWIYAVSYTHLTLPTICSV